MSLEENNKMIATFMGMQSTNIGWYDAEEVICDPSGDNTFDDLLFDTDWNWLMSVIDVIEDLRTEESEFDTEYNVDILQCFVEITNTRTTDTIIETDRNTKKEAVYAAVVLFIQWYNTITV